VNADAIPSAISPNEVRMTGAIIPDHIPSGGSS
jgi:hypothetical protein